MLYNSQSTITVERQLYMGLLKEYRRPCYAQGANKPLTIKFVDDLIALYNIVWDQLPTDVSFDDIDLLKRDLISDINYEITQALKKAEIEFKYVVSKLRDNASINAWETITASHVLI